MAPGVYQAGAARREKNGFLRIERKNAKPLAVLEENPFQALPPFEKLLGDLTGAYSRRINIHHRLVYQVLKEERIVKVLRMWTHYE